MLRSILVPIDGSRFSEQALPLAVHLASRDGASLHLVMVAEPTSPLGRVHGTRVFDPRLDQHLREEKEAYLADLARRIQDEHSVPTTATVREGPVATTLAGRAAEGDIDLVIMTTHGRGGISRMWLGSVADALVRRVEIPLLLVRAAEDGGAPAITFPPRRTLIALDGSELAESIVDDAIAVAGTRDVTYVLLRVSDPAEILRHTAEIVGYERDSAAERHAQAAAYVDDVARRLSVRGLQIEKRIVDHVNIADGILESAREAGADLVAMATHGRSGGARIVMGSVADSVVRAAQLPVLLRRPVGMAVSAAERERGTDRARTKG